MTFQRQLPIGAELLKKGGAHFRVWAPHVNNMFLVIEDSQAHQVFKPITMTKDAEGYMSCFYPEAQADLLYRFKINHELYPDPASRFQPEGPHGPSQLIDFRKFIWRDNDWQGISAKHRVIYEMHIGTFTPEGTYAAATKELSALAELGITIIELMPIAEFEGKFGWGYDGVGFFAPYHCYGTPDELRALVNEAHRLCIGIILDVVYNHCGSSGCYLHKFSKDYFSSTYTCEWGDAFNFDGENSLSVREFFLSNVRYWIEEFHLDGFRLDATQQIYDMSSEHIIVSITNTARKAAKNRDLYIVAENEPQHSKTVRPKSKNGYGLDGIWNDDFHHSATVALKGHNEAYFTDYQGKPQEFISAIKYGFLYQGQWYRWQKQARGTATFDLPSHVFVHFLQNHDQIANSGLGKRIHHASSAGVYRAFTALLLLSPPTPMLFQGQEFCSSSPFLYFADHNAEFAESVKSGRSQFLHQFPSLAAPETQAYLSRPDDPTTFTRSKLNLSERESHHEAYNLHKDLLALRRDDPVFSQANSKGLDGAVLSSSAFVLRFFSSDEDSDRLLLINFGIDLALTPVPEPLLAPHSQSDWKLFWSSENPRYGGQGIHPLHTQDDWLLPGFCACVLIPEHPVDVNDTKDFGGKHHV